MQGSACETPSKDHDVHFVLGGRQHQNTMACRHTVRGFVWFAASQALACQVVGVGAQPARVVWRRGQHLCGSQLELEVQAAGLSRLGGAQSCSSLQLGWPRGAGSCCLRLQARQLLRSCIHMCPQTRPPG